MAAGKALHYSYQDQRLCSFVVVVVAAGQKGCWGQECRRRSAVAVEDMAVGCFGDKKMAVDQNLSAESAENLVLATGIERPWAAGFALWNRRSRSDLELDS